MLIDVFDEISGAWLAQIATELDEKAQCDECAGIWIRSGGNLGTRSIPGSFSIRWPDGSQENLCYGHIVLDGRVRNCVIEIMN